MSVTLYADKFWISPYVLTCFVALREKAVDFVVRDLSLGDGDQKQASFAPSLTGRVPALEHDGFWLAESSAIAEYVDEAFPGAPVMPRELKARSRARQLLGWIRSDLMALREERSTDTIFYAKTDKPLTDAGRAAAEKLVRVVSTLLESAPKGGSTIFEHFTVVDADLTLMLQRLVANGDDVPAHVRAYAETNWKRPSIAEFVAHVRPPFVRYY